MIIKHEVTNVLLSQIMPASQVTEEKIYSFKKLERGWHYGEGVPFEHSILDNAISLNQEAMRLALFETDAFPGANGEVMVTIYYHDHYLEFTLEPDGSVTFYHEEREREVDYQEGLSFQQAEMEVGKFREKRWNVSGSLTESTIGTGEENVSTAWLFEIAGIPLESPLSEATVYSILAKLFVNTSTSTILDLLTNQFSGASQLKFYRPVTT